MQQPCFIRTLDDLCRVAIPKDIRKSFRLDAGDDLCVGVEGSRIVITPVKNALFDPQFGEVLGQKYGHADWGKNMGKNVDTREKRTILNYRIPLKG